MPKIENSPDMHRNRAIFNHLNDADSTLVELNCAVANLSAIWEAMTSGSLDPEDYANAVYSVYTTLFRCKEELQESVNALFRERGILV